MTTKRKTTKASAPAPAPESVESPAPVTPAPVPAVSHPRQRIKRTAVQTALGYIAAAITVLPVVLDAILQLKAYLPGALVVGLVSALGVAVAASAALAKLMSIPAVDAWLTARINLGQVPRIEASSDPGPDGGDTEADSAETDDTTTDAQPAVATDADTGTDEATGPEADESAEGEDAAEAS